MAKRATTRAAADKRVRVRMYRQGLGDCFLLTFPGAGGKPFHMVIDCGVCKGAKGGGDRMRQVVADIARTTGAAIDVLVATHEHFDHLSGFQQARTEWKGIAIGELWLAWTEKPRDSKAKEVRDALGKKKKEVVTALMGLQGSRTFQLDLARGRDVIGLLNCHDLAVNGLAAGGSEKLEETFRLLKAGVKKKEYLRPHTLHKHAGLPGVEVFVLGPPRDLVKIGRSEVSTRAPEVYLGSQGPVAFSGTSSTLASTAVGPFPIAAGTKVGENWEDGAHEYELVYGHYFGQVNGMEQEQPWRELGSANLDDVAHLAMALVRDTNNTSLALAFRLSDGRVLLFPGDAQVGNCLSWHDADWKVGNKRVTAQHLLDATVLYKVAHHGSENATMKDAGLEMMGHPDLVALVPLEESQSALLGYSGKMPWLPMFKRLKERTRGRVIFSDTKRQLPQAKDLKQLSPAELKCFQDNVVATELFIEITL